jgi:hypothetical protein
VRQRPRGRRGERTAGRTRACRSDRPRPRPTPPRPPRPSGRRSSPDARVSPSSRRQCGS